MKTLSPMIGILPAVIGLVCCGAFAARAQVPRQSGEHPARVSSTYRPPAFADPDRLQKIEAVLPEVKRRFEHFAEEKEYPGFVYGVVMGDSLVLSGALGTLDRSTRRPVTPASKFHIASMTKSFTAMAILMLRDAGKLSLRDPVSDYIPQLRQVTYLTRDAHPIEIRNLMTMTSGLPEDNPWADRQLDDSTEELMRLLEKGVSFSSIPSHQYEYSNLGYALLGTVVSRVAGVPYRRYITEQILKPLGMTDTHWDYGEVPEGELARGYRRQEGRWKEEPLLHTGAFGAIGGLITSLRDFSKYVAFHLSAYPPRSEPERGPIRRSSVREMHRALSPHLVAEAEDASGEPCPYLWGYGYGLVVRKNCEERVEVSHTGGLPGFGSNYRFYPDYDLGIISFANRTYASTGAANEQARDVLFEQSGIAPRKRRVSEILAKRARQVARLIQTWGEELGEKILAENFYLDEPRALREKAAGEILQAAGDIMSVGPVTPANQLRGTFVMHGERANVNVFFSLSPEAVPKVQALRVKLAGNHRGTIDRGDD